MLAAVMPLPREEVDASGHKDILRHGSGPPGVFRMLPEAGLRGNPRTTSGPPRPTRIAPTRTRGSTDHRATAASRSALTTGSMMKSGSLTKMTTTVFDSGNSMNCEP